MLLDQFDPPSWDAPSTGLGNGQLHIVNQSREHWIGTHALDRPVLIALIGSGSECLRRHCLHQGLEDEFDEASNLVDVVGSPERL